jgi:hypothetical protein
MILRALEFRHRRYMAHVYSETETAGPMPLERIVDGVA